MAANVFASTNPGEMFVMRNVGNLVPPPAKDTGEGEAVAADTGGAVRGASIDLWFPSVAQANAWGRRTVTIVLR